MRGAHRLNERVHAPARVHPDLFAERMVTRLSVQVIEQIRPPVLRPPADLARRGDHRLYQMFGDLPLVARHVRDLSPISAHGVPLLVAERVREHEMCLEAERAADEGERDPRRPGRVFDHRPARRKSSGRGRALYNRASHPVLHAAGGVGRFELHDHTRTVARNDAP
jgi:hypothetical protein